MGDQSRRSKRKAKDPIIRYLLLSKILLSKVASFIVTTKDFMPSMCSETVYFEGMVIKQSWEILLGFD